MFNINTSKRNTQSDETSEILTTGETTMYQINSVYQLDDEATAAKDRRAFYLQCLRTHLKAKRLKNQVRKAFRASNSIVEKCFYLAVIEELNNF